MSNKAWNLIFNTLDLKNHNFALSPYYINSKQIKEITKVFTDTSDREVRILCKQDTRETRPQVFKDNNLFILPVKNGSYAILQGEGYVDIPEIDTKTNVYNSKLDFVLETSKIGNSEMQHLDLAYASSIIRTFCCDNSLVLTIRGRKYTPNFVFNFDRHEIKTGGVQTEVDAGYEGKNNIILIEAKNSQTSNTIIRQIYYPYRQWQIHSQKKVSLIFFEKRQGEFYLWQYHFEDIYNYSSIKLLKSAKYLLV